MIGKFGWVMNILLRKITLGCICIFPSSLWCIRTVLSKEPGQILNSHLDQHFDQQLSKKHEFLPSKFSDCIFSSSYFDVEFIRILSRKLPSSREEGEVSLIYSTKTHNLMFLHRNLLSSAEFNVSHQNLMFLFRIRFSSSEFILSFQY